ncbi:hypothetical protein [Mycolicibacterium vulneris]|uniref:hypothetical protein n=1 Tax=Mycolicibacterium vulneris TaxID=547163 RepID=UPI0010553E39|nr:hypothetical protein [Mycolicibacterium vulneris]
MIDDLTAKVAQLLAEPPPRPVRGVQKETATRGPIGLAITVFRAARDLVAEINYVEAVNDWEQRQARLRELDVLLSSGVVNAAGREALRDEVESLRLSGFARVQRMAAVCSALGVVTKAVGTIVRGCGERRAAESQASAVTRPDDLARQRACEQINAETLRVLGLHEHTAAMSLTDAYCLVVQRN